ncbi:MAG: sulfur oxidation c-type cytochrome SoxA [Pseudomonadota bacterium]
MKQLSLLALAVIAACSGGDAPQTEYGEGLQPSDIQSGYVFLTAETQTLQDDTFANPGYLWVDRGRALFERVRDQEPACATCHEDGLVGAAAGFPKLDSQTGKLINLEQQVNLCRERHQNLPVLAYESEDLLALTAYLANQSADMASTVETDGALSAHLEIGREYFYTRRGQLNLSCHQCHDQNWGAKLRGDTISQGHLNGFPAYRLEWEGMGSSHRRLQDCDTGVRAEPLPAGDPVYVALELYLAARAGELPLESPAVRR